MRRLFNALAVLTLVVSLSTATAFAAPRRDDGDSNRSPIQRIVQIIKRIVKAVPLDDVSWPKP